MSENKIYISITSFIASVILICLLFTGAAEASTNDPANDQEAPEISYVNDDTEFCMAVSGMPEPEDPAIKETADICASRLLIVCEDTFDCSDLDGLTEAVFDDDGLCVMQFDSIANAEKAYDQLQDKKQVLSVEFDSVVHAEDQQPQIIKEVDTVDGHMSWGVAGIGADEYQDYVGSFNTRQLIVAVVDTGVDAAHPFLQSRMTAGYDFIRDDDIPDDEDGHGTHVAGIIADCTLGMNDILIMPVKILDETGEGSISGIGNGVMYAADNGAEVINLSLGGYHSAYLDILIRRAMNKGAVIVAASGNEGMNINWIKACPAHMEELITVGAVDKNMDLESYSNYGKTLDFVAPGTDITSTFPDSSYITYSGTSMAAPHVSACAALLKLRYPKADCGQIESVLKRSCDDIEGTSRDGSGVVNMRNLLSDISSQKVTLSDSSYVYTGKPIAAGIKASRNGERLFKNQDYSVTYENNKKVGTATAVVYGEGSYYGAEAIQYKIVPKGTDIRTVSPVKKGFSLKWKKQSAQTDGYQIQYSLNKSFSNARTRTIKGSGKVTYKKTKLKSGKKYYVRIRTYKMVNGKKYCSSWSKRRSVKTK